MAEDTKIDLGTLSAVQFESYHGDAVAEGAIGSGPERMDTPIADDELFVDQTTAAGKEALEEKQRRGWFDFLSVDYYQPYFDVTSRMVLHRMAAGMCPVPFSLADVIGQSPDLYGPFWICMTLIFTTAISGNVARILSGNKSWQFHFHEVTVLGTVIYGYTWLVPLVLWGLLIWRKTANRLSLLQLLAIYGYSMAIFVPLTVLWLINVNFLRWLLLAVAATLSGLVLVRALREPFITESKSLSLTVLTIVFLLHAGVAVGFKLYYFSSGLAPSPDISLGTEIITHTNEPLPTF